MIRKAGAISRSTSATLRLEAPKHGALHEQKAMLHVQRPHELPDHHAQLTREGTDVREVVTERNISRRIQKKGVQFACV